MGTTPAVATQQYLTFRLAEETYAVDVAQAREILDLMPITIVPGAPEYVTGIINVRGNVVPVVDMRRKLGLPPSPPSVGTCIVVLESGSNGTLYVFGALVDSVQEVLELDPSSIEPPPSIGSATKSPLLRGIGKTGDRFLILVEPERLFRPDETAELSSEHLDGLSIAALSNQERA